MLTVASGAWRALAGVAVILIGCVGFAAARSEAALPDGRAYEMVSPLQKNGGDIMSDSARTRAAATASPSVPMAATFTSLAGFGDVHGTGVGTEYMSQRVGAPGTNGWKTHAITPKQDPLTFLAEAAVGGDPLYVGEFSADLSAGVYRAWAPVTNEPNVADISNLYLRTDLRTAGPGTYELLSNSATLLPPSLRKTYFAGASEDFTHTVFETQLNLTTDASGGSPKLYVMSDVGLTLVQVPGAPTDVSCAGAGCVPALSAVAGQGQIRLRYTPNVISNDGTRVIFASPVDAGGGPITGGGDETRLYMRDNQGTVDPSDDTTVKINASELAVPDTPQAATYQDAAEDGSRVFFLSNEQLTTDAISGVSNLYMWDSSGAPGARLTRLNVAYDNGPSNVAGVIGTSADGHYVYFVAGAPLLPEATPFIPGIYLWHDGDLAYVGSLANPGVDTTGVIPNSWGLIPNTARARVAPDGKHLVFSATSGDSLLDPAYDQATACLGDPSLDRRPGCAEYYVYSADTQTLRCASCRPDHAPATQDADVNSRPLSTGGTNTTWHLSRALAGRYVFFNSLESLVADDRNGRIDAYRFDIASGDVSLISTGKSTADSYFLDASPDGSDVFFTTRQRLVGWDRDEAYDLYDARVGGGFPEPPAAQPVCGGDSCQGDLAGAPADLAPGSAAYLGRGNLAGRLRAHKKPRRKACKRGFKRKRVHGHVRCVKRKQAGAGRLAARRAESRRNGR